MTVNPDPSDRLRRLGRLAADLVLGHDIDGRAIDDDNLPLLARRHHLAPLLHGAVQSGARCGGEAQAAFAQAYAANARRQALAGLAIQRLAALFAAHQTPWLVLKGLPQARMLYRDPAWRRSTDLDLLVRPEDFAAVVGWFPSEGMAPDGGSPRLAGAVGRLLLGQIRDVTFSQPGLDARIELHQRPFFAIDANQFGPCVAEALRPRQVEGRTDVPAPDAGAGLAFYLILHGALSQWLRLKWLIDLAPLLARMSPQAGEELSAAAEAAGALVTVKASLRLLGLVLGEAALGPMAVWVAEPTLENRVQSRVAEYLLTLDDPSPTAAMHGGSRLQSLRAALQLTDRTAYRAAVLANAPISALARWLTLGNHPS